MSVQCSPGNYGLEVRVRYGSSIEDTDDAAATLTRMRVYMDGRLRTDSGPISDRRYAREVTFQGSSSRLHSVQLRIDTRAAPKPADFVQVVQCPPAPETPLA
jgi:hypothetical protein